VRPAALALLLLGMASCCPQPRAASYFKAHPREANTVLAGCVAGTRRGGECDTAQAGLEQIESDKRLALYKSGF